MDKLPQFRVLGPFEALNPDGEPIDFGHRKVRALLAYLAVEHGRPQAREHLASLLWARTGEERARHNLRQALSKLRVLCPDLIDTPGDSIALNPSACSIDALRFEQFAHSEDADELRQALGLYRGDLLHGYNTSEPDYQDWLELARARLRRSACEIADRLAGLLRTQGRVREAIKVLNRLLAFDLANETAHRDLMELLARSGRRSDALRQFQVCTAALAQELGVEPGAATKRLAEDIRQGRLETSVTNETPSVAVANPVIAGGRHSDLRRESATILVADTERDRRPSGSVDRLVGAVERHRGEIRQQGVGSLLAEFEAPGDALSAAMAMQGGLDGAGNRVERERRSTFRIGIDCGEVVDAGEEIGGNAVNVALRLEALAEAGGICISDAVRSAVEGRVPAIYQFIGEQQVRNVDYPVRAYRVTSSGGEAVVPAGNGQRASAPGLELPGKPSLIIKPFLNISADADQDYFAEGLTKDISIALTKIPGLFLAADETPRARIAQKLNATELGHEFGVRYVLTGGVRRHGARVRVNAELIDASTGQCLWGERFDRELHDLFSIQDEITEEIVTAMDVKLVQGEAARFMRKALTNPAALEASYRGWYALYHGTGRQDVLEAQRLFEQVIQLQPESPLGYASAALAYWAEAGFGRVVVHSPAMERSVDLARKALELGDTTGYAHLVMAVEHLAHHEYDQAMAQATEGVAARPNCNGAYAIKSSVLNFLGRPQDAIAFAQYAVRLTPLYPAEFPAVLAASLHDSGRYDEAIAAARASLQLRSDDIDPMLILAAAHVAQGNLGEAREIAGKVRQLEPAFRLAEFAETQPYRNPKDLERLIGRLREAGLPD